MKPLFFDTRDLDKLSRERYGLSEELMMENAAAELEKVIFFKNVIILCGSGNNGADGYTLARRLSGKDGVKISAVEILDAKSELCKIQKKRFELLGGKVLDFNNFSFQLKESCCIVDCVFGSGFHGEFNTEISTFFEKINSLKPDKDCQIVKIACDVPSGLRNDGTFCENAFESTETVSMGALKTCLYSDAAKDLCGKISVGNLGIQREKFENSWQGLKNECAPQMYLLEKNDYKPPVREKKVCNKGTFGHVTVFSGEKSGASVIAGLSALKFGAGLVTLCGKNDISAFPELMSAAAENIPSKTNAVVAGPGFGRENPEWKKVFSYLDEHENVCAVLDADAFYRKELPEFLRNCKNKVVLTPHPKEFQNLYEICFGENITVARIIEKRVELAKKFVEEFKTIILVLKGSNPVIAAYNIEKNEAELFTTDLGCPSLAKAGSGDVLSGLIASLLAQNYSPVEAAKNGVLSHAIGSAKFEENWTLTPLSLIAKIE